MIPIFLILSVILAVIPTAVYLLIVWWMDRYSREPLGIVVAAFVWGASGAVVISLISQLGVGFVMAQFLGHGDAEFAGAVFVAPLTEEPAKALALLFIALRRDFDNVTDGVVYGVACGMGFAMTENVLYFWGASMGGPAHFVVIVFLRTFWSAVMHGVASSIAGAGIGYARHAGNFGRVIAVMFGFAGAILLHGLFNGGLMTASATENALPALLSLTITPLMLVIMIALTQVSLAYESRMIRTELIEEVAANLIPLKAAQAAASWLSRGDSSWVPPGANKHRLLESLTTLAFRKHQMKHGRPHRGAIEEIEAIRDDLRAVFQPS